MAKDRERRTAQILYVDQNLTAKDVAERVGVSEKTIGDWVEKHNWKALRDAKNSSPAKRINNIKQIISNMSDEWLECDREVKKLERVAFGPITKKRLALGSWRHLSTQEVTLLKKL